jgi:hypothetical protein
MDVCFGATVSSEQLGCVEQRSDPTAPHFGTRGVDSDTELDLAEIAPRGEGPARIGKLTSRSVARRTGGQARAGRGLPGA